MDRNYKLNRWIRQDEYTLNENTELAILTETVVQMTHKMATFSKVTLRTEVHYQRVK